MARVWLHNMHIAPYKAARENYDPGRPHKLLLHRREIERLIGKTAEGGLYPGAHPHLLQRPAGQGGAGPGAGQDLHDKRHSIKERDTRRGMSSAVRLSEQVA